MLLFVYGSLRKGLQNNYRLESSKFIGQCNTCDEYIMVGLKSKSYPYVIDKELFIDIKPTKIIGELYEVDNEIIEKLDKLEDHPNTYKRRETKVIINNNIITSNIYILEDYSIINIIKKYLKNNWTKFVLVENGDWKLFTDKTIF